MKPSSHWYGAPKHPGNLARHPCWTGLFWDREAFYSCCCHFNIMPFLGRSSHNYQFPYNGEPGTFLKDYYHMQAIPMFFECFGVAWENSAGVSAGYYDSINGDGDDTKTRDNMYWGENSYSAVGGGELWVRQAYFFAKPRL